MADTKEQLTEAFWQLLEKKPYKKITVRDIVDYCQVNRNTFYYHFAGIPDLLKHAVQTWETGILSAGQASGAPLLCILPAARACMEHRAAISHLKDSKAWPDVQNTIREICSRAAASYVGSVMNPDTIKKTAQKNSSAAVSSKNPEHDRELLIRFFQSVLSGCLLDWMNGDMQEDLAADLRRIIELLEDPDCPFFRQGGTEHF